MSKFGAILAIGCIVTLVLFGVMCYLITTVNPPPLPETTEESKHDPLLEELARVTSVPQRTNNVTENHRRLLKYSIQRVVPPVWPNSTKPPVRPNKPKPPINKSVGSPENRVLNKTGKVGPKSTTPIINDTLSVIKRSVIDAKKLGDDLNSFVLKIIDDSGRFNIEIKIGLNDTNVKKKNETKQDKIQSKEKSKYSTSLKTKDNDQLNKTKLANNTIIRVIANDFVTVDEYDDHLEAKNKIKNNMIQASIVNFNNITKYNDTENKTTVKPIYRDVFKPIVIFYNQTKSIYHSHTKTKKNEQRDLLETPNDACKTNHNSFKTTNHTTYNVTTQTEKEAQITDKGDLLEKPNDASDGSKTNVNSSNTAYNLTTKTEKGDNKTEKWYLFEKPNEVSGGCKKNVNSSKTAYNLTTKTEKGDNKTEKWYLFEKPNEVSDGCKKNVNSSKTAYNLTTQIEKGDNKTEKWYLLEKPNEVSNRCKNNLNFFKTANNTPYNLTIKTEKANNTAYSLTITTEKANSEQTETTTLQYYVVSTRNETTTVEEVNSTVSTKTLDETSTMAEEVYSTITVNGNSDQNDTRDLIEMKRLVQSQNITTI